MKRIFGSAAVIVAVGAFLALTLGSSKGSSGDTYKIELQNAFGLVNGAAFKVDGLPAGTIKTIGLDQKSLNALVTDLADSSNPLATDLSAYLPGAATDLADFFQSALSYLSI